MAPLPVIANTYRVAINWFDHTHGQAAENVIHIRGAGSDAASVAAAVDGAMTHHMIDPCSTYGTIQSYTVTPLDGSSATITRTATGITAGSQTDADFAPAAACVVSLYTGKRGRSYRGRVYLPFIAESVLSEGTLNDTERGNVVSGWTAFLTAMSGLTLVVASYKHATAENVTQVSCVAGVGTQRRRQERVRYPGS